MMMLSFSSLDVAIAIFSLVTRSQAQTVTYSVPSTVPTTAAVLDPAPVGISFEFFTFPSYFTNVTATNQCLQNFESLTGTWPPIRIGGTTQDRATYDPTSPAFVTYTVATSTTAPSSLTFGPAFLTLAGTYLGTVVLGLNRALDNLANTIAAAKVAKCAIENLWAIELGNEPEFWSGVPITANGWSAAIDAVSQNNWAVAVGEGIGSTDIIELGNSFYYPPSWGAAELIATENASVLSYVKDYAHHNYPDQALATLMSHTSIVNNLNDFTADIAAANSVGKEYVWGETNSVSGGGGATECPTFGATLWTMDFILRSAVSNVVRSYFHHGTIGLCYYCWWGRYDMGSPYYGAYAAVAAMAGGTYIAALDSGSNYAAYGIYNSTGSPLRVLLYNSDYYDTTSARTTEVFTLTGLTGISSVSAKRLTATSALSRNDQGQPPTFGGQQFQNGTCNIVGTETFETTTVTGGVASFSLLASEALLIYLS